MGFSRTTVSIFTAFFCILYLVFVVWLGNAFYLNKQSQPDFDENKSSQTNVYANFHYKSQGSQMRAAPFNYSKN